MATLTELTEIRELILKNSIYNRILVAKLSNTPNYTVASTLLKLKTETKEELKKDVNRKRLPTYALYSIIVKFNEVGNYSIGLQFPAHPVICDYPSISLGSLRKLAEFIYAKYSINPAKSDKIFSAIPSDAKTFLVSNNYPSRFWYQGFSKKLQSPDTPIFDNTKVDRYLEELRRRNSEYRMFNTILLSMLKVGRYEKKQPAFGSITVSNTTTESKFYVTFESELDFRTYSGLFPISVFSPPLWDTYESDIDKSVLVIINK